MDERGVVVGCDRGQEWLLPWWWQHYSAHSTYPVLFADFGMSQEAVTWCKKRGQVLLVPPCPPLPLDKIAVSAKKQQSWEIRSGVEVWSYRSTWFRKPFALLQVPFSSALWIDLDCEVNGSLDPIFNYLKPGIDLVINKERDEQQKMIHALEGLLPGEENYNSGVLAFRKGAPILHQWVEQILSHSTEFMGDQEALSRAIFLHKPSLVELPDIYNWSMGEAHNYGADFGESDKAVIRHFHGMQLKVLIGEKILLDLRLGYG